MVPNQIKEFDNKSFTYLSPSRSKHFPNRWLYRWDHSPLYWRISASRSSSCSASAFWPLPASLSGHLSLCCQYSDFWNYWDLIKTLLQVYNIPRFNHYIKSPLWNETFLMHLLVHSWIIIYLFNNHNNQ